MIALQSLDPRTGVAFYLIDPSPAQTDASTYVVRRNGVEVGRIVGRLGNAWPLQDLVLWPGKHTVTLDVDGVIETLDVLMPEHPVSTGGDVLCVWTQFSDIPHAPIDETPIRNGCAWITTITHGKTTWRPAFASYTTQEPKAAYYDAYGNRNITKLLEEIVAALGLDSRPGLHRVVIEMTGAGIEWSRAARYRLLQGDPNSVDAAWAVLHDAQAWLHELLHLYGLDHTGYLPNGLPTNIDYPADQRSSYSAEIMGSSTQVQQMCGPVRSRIGALLPGQIVIPPAWGGMFALEALDRNGSGPATICLPAGDAGSSYWIELWGGLPRLILRPMHWANVITQYALPLPQSGNVLLDDTARGIKVTYSGLSASGMTVNITTPIAAPPPPPPPPPKHHGRKR